MTIVDGTPTGWPQPPSAANGAGPLLDTVVTRMVLPHGLGTIEFERQRLDGNLVGICAAGRTYLDVEADGTWHWPGVCRVSERRVGESVMRTVTTADGKWTEHYRWHGDDLVEVDGVVIERDGEGRIVACVPGGENPAQASHRWFYSWSDDGLIDVRGPGVNRAVTVDASGRPVRVHEDGVVSRIVWDSDSHRIDGARPFTDHVDEAGRTWVSYDRGAPTIWLWDGTRCLARIDGPLGSQLGAVFSLDPSATPVRVTTSTGSTRIPRDALGESLLTIDDVPGLFGGRIANGLVHLPLRRLDPRTGAFAEPDPWHGGDDDPRRGDSYQGPLLTELEPRSAYEVCRGDSIGRADPTGGVSAGLIISGLTWSFQNNVLAFFGIDWWFNLFGSLLVAPFKGLGNLDYDFFSSTAKKTSDHLGAFGVRRGGIINEITGGRAFTTSHIVWSPDSAFERLELGEVIDPGGDFRPTHYGSILSATIEDERPLLMQCMDHSSLGWATGNALADWSRHGGTGQAVAPGTLSFWCPEGGLHLDNNFPGSRGDNRCDLAELVPAEVGLGDLEARSFLTASTSTGFAVNDLLLVDDGDLLWISELIGLVPVGGAQRLQLRDDLGSIGAGFGAAGLSVTEVTAAAAPEVLRAGALANSIDTRGAANSYARNDLVRLTSGPDITVARIERLEASVPLDRPLPAGFGGPIQVHTGMIDAVTSAVTIAGSDLDFGTGARPPIGATGIVSGGGDDISARVEAHGTGAVVTIDTAVPASISGAAAITWRTVNSGPLLGTRMDPAEAGATITYLPTTSNAAPDGSSSLTAIRCVAGGVEHARIVSRAPNHDVAIIDRAFTGVAPHTVERFSTASTVGGLSRTEVTALIVPDPGRFSSAPAVMLTRVDGATPTVAATVFSGVDVANGVVATNASGAGPTVGVGQPVSVDGRTAVVRRIRTTVTFDRSHDLSAEGLQLVELSETGHSYHGRTLDASTVLAEGVIDDPGGAGTLAVPFPRFEVGDVVAVRDRGAGTVLDHYRVTSVDGGRLALDDGAALPPASDVFVQHLETSDPANGGPFIGIAGASPASGPTTTAAFDVWTSAEVAGGRYGVVDGAQTRPVEVTSATQPLELTFSESFSATGVDVASLTHRRTSFFTTLAMDGGALLLEGAEPALETNATESLIAVAYTPGGASTTGTLGPGTLLIPVEESIEVDRSQALTDHELVHTLQYSRWGPLWYNIFPMLAMELPAILATDTELPEFSEFLGATVAAGTDDRWDVTVPDRAGVTIEVDDTVQLVQGSRHGRATVTAVNGDVVEVRFEGTNVGVGTASLRKKQREDAFDDWYAFFDLLTHGGLLNLVGGSTWGGIFWLIGQAFYGLGTWIGGDGDVYAATVQAGGAAITITNDDDLSEFRESGTVIVRQGEDNRIRSMTRSGNVVTLTEAIPFTGAVQMAMYDRHEPGSNFDWYSYYPATVSTDNPFVITVGPAEGNTISLDPEDRVVIRYRDQSPCKTDVVAVNGDQIELLEPITIVDGETSLRIAKVGASDPLGNADSAAMVEMGMDWMKWIYDPYGQIEYAAAPDEEWARYLLRVMRWIIGTQNFSLLPGGYLWWGRLIPITPEHLTRVEQEASEKSGELYTAMARLHGENNELGFGEAGMVVGDIARYRYWPIDNHPTVRVNFVRDAGARLLDRPGLPYRRQIRVMPHRANTNPASGPVNEAIEVDQTLADAGLSVAELFTDRTASLDPRVVPDRIGFNPSLIGQVPVGPRTERMQSSYVSFTRPGDHRVTMDDVFIPMVRAGINGADEAGEAQRAEAQTIFFDVTVADVIVTAAGQTIDDTTPGTSDRLTMIPFQRARVQVTPTAGRVYHVTPADPLGPSLGLQGVDQLVAGTTPNQVEVEVSRAHIVTADGSYGSGGLAFAGTHLSRSVHIPVRRFTVDVVNTLSVLDAADPAATAQASLAIGDDGFVLVPAPIYMPPTVRSIAGATPPAGVDAAITAVAAPAAGELLGTQGAAFQLNFPAGTPTGEVIIDIDVGTAADNTTVTVTFDLT